MSKLQDNNREFDVNGEKTTTGKSQTAGKRYFRFLSNVNLNSAFFERDHVYPLPESVLTQIPAGVTVEVSYDDIQSTQRRIADDQARLDELNRAGQRRPLQVEDDTMAQAALNPVVGRPVVRYPDAQHLDRNTVSADDAGKAVEQEGTAEGEAPTKGKDFRSAINKK